MTVTTSSTSSPTIRNGTSPGRPTLIPSAIVDGRSTATGRTRGQRGRVGRGARRLDADDPHVGADRLDRDRYPRGQAAAADAHDDRAHLGALLQDLQPQRALARDDVGVVEGVDEDGAGPLRVLLGRRQRLVDHLAVQPYLGAVLPGGRDLGQRGPDRHEDGGADAQQGRGEGHSLGVVARAGGDHARGPFLGESPAIRTYAPRSLKEPVRWRFSHLRWTGAPTSSERWRLPSIIVTLATPASIFCAPRTSSSVTLGGWTALLSVMAPVWLLERGPRYAAPPPDPAGPGNRDSARTVGGPAAYAVPPTVPPARSEPWPCP